jgi:hypothetical protein
VEFAQRRYIGLARRTGKQNAKQNAIPLMLPNQKAVLDLYIARQRKRGNTSQSIEDHSTDAIQSCKNWRLNITLSPDEFQRLVLVVSPASNPLLTRGRLLSQISKEAHAQIAGVWKSKWNKDWIKQIVDDLHQDRDALIGDPLLLRTKSFWEPRDGSYYVQDGNHRILAAGLFFLETGMMPNLHFHIGTLPKFSSFYASLVLQKIRFLW